MHPFIAITDFRWYRFLSSRAIDGRLDEVSFWSPQTVKPLRAFEAGEPVFFRLKAPESAIAGYAYFAHFMIATLEEAWHLFDWKNGASSFAEFLDLITGYGNPATVRDAADLRRGFTVLVEAQFLPRSDWIPWGDAQGWHRNVVRGATESDPARVAILLEVLRRERVDDDIQAEFGDRFRLLGTDGRRLVEARFAARDGQGAFRARLLEAYDRRCAVTGERTEPVLDAAHIQPYLGLPSNHIQNGIVLTKEFHTLFDRGYVGITPDYRVAVSPALRLQWQNGRRYYQYDDKPLVHLPADRSKQPSREALEWHMHHVYRTA